MAQHKLPPAESPANKIFLGLILKWCCRWLSIQW
jgi:hypothetical protein